MPKHRALHSKKNVAIVYDRVNSFGGAERVLLALHQAFPEAPLYTSVFDRQSAKWVGDWKVIPSFLQRIPFFRRRHQLLAALMPIAFESFNFDQYDLVISVSSEAAKGIVTKPHTKHIAYMLTPTRYLWSHELEYLHDHFAGFMAIFRPLAAHLFAHLQVWDKVAATRPDNIVSISKLVDQRVQHFYDRASKSIIYPPVDASRFQVETTSPQTQPYFLCVSRLVPYKRIDQAIRACIQLKKHLVIIGTGSDMLRLRFIAKFSPYIHFLGQLTDEETVRYYQHSIALVMPGEEDFGITGLEALAAGVPAIVNARSGIAELVEHGKHGYHLDSTGVSAITAALQEVEHSTWDKAELQKHAKQYDLPAFVHTWKEIE